MTWTARQTQACSLVATFLAFREGISEKLSIKEVISSHLILSKKFIWIGIHQDLILVKPIFQ